MLMGCWLCHIKTFTFVNKPNTCNSSTQLNVLPAMTKPMIGQTNQHIKFVFWIWQDWNTRNIWTTSMWQFIKKYVELKRRGLSKMCKLSPPYQISLGQWWVQFCTLLQIPLRLHHKSSNLKQLYNLLHLNWQYISLAVDKFSEPVQNLTDLPSVWLQPHRK